MKHPLVSPCREWAEKLALAHSTDLSLADRQALETHMASCPACYAVFEEYQSLDERLHQALHAQEALSISSVLLSAEKKVAISKKKGHQKTMYRKRDLPPLQKISSFGRLFNALAAILVLSLLVGGFWALSTARHRPDATGTSVERGLTATSVTLPSPTATSLPSPTATPLPSPTVTPLPSPTATPLPTPPSSVRLRISAPGISPTAQGTITIPAGTTVTLSVVPDHSLLPFQTFTMGIYATDPFGFSELQYCKYPNTNTCSYVVAFSASENTDYTHGKHTFRAFLGDIGGAILTNSSSITIIWS